MDYLKVVTVDFVSLFDMSIGNHRSSDMSYRDEDWVAIPTRRIRVEEKERE